MNNPDIIDVAPKSAGSNNTAQIAGGKQINIAIETIDASYLPLRVSCRANKKN